MDELERFPPFAGLDGRALARAAALARRRRFERGEFLLLEGEPCRAV